MRKTTDKHGLKMAGLKEASGQTISFGNYSGVHYRISYDIWNGEICVDRLSSKYSAVENDEVSDLITVGDVKTHLSMQQIADMVYNGVKQVLKKTPDGPRKHWMLIALKHQGADMEKLTEE
jgi:hypothetical protein